MLFSHYNKTRVRKKKQKVLFCFDPKLAKLPGVKN
jgi:hypothetical protein